jgi:hypothetical protein
MRATVADAASSRTPSVPSGSSHSELKRTSVRSRSRISQNWSSTRSAYPRTTSLSRRLRVSDLPEGSPTLAVTSPTINTAVCPASWN